ncbi:MAG: glycine/sarcosine/betaine reductase component B subunit [Gammaproteobacteria bacterium]
MTLTLNTVDVRDVRLGDVTHLEGGRLTLNANALAAELESVSPSIADVRISIAHPGEQTRIVCVKDSWSWRSTSPPVRARMSTSL